MIAQQASSVAATSCVIFGHTESQYTANFGTDAQTLARYKRFLKRIVDARIEAGVRTFYVPVQSGAPYWMAKHIAAKRSMERGLGLRLIIVRPTYDDWQLDDRLADLLRQMDKELVVPSRDDYAFRDAALRAADMLLLIEHCPNASMVPIQAAFRNVPVERHSLVEFSGFLQTESTGRTRRSQSRYAPAQTV